MAQTGAAPACGAIWAWKMPSAPNSVVMAYPDALNGNWDVGEATSQRDMTFIRDLVTRLIADGIADRRRIYLLGASTGGLARLPPCLHQSRPVCRRQHHSGLDAG